MCRLFACRLGWRIPSRVLCTIPEELWLAARVLLDLLSMKSPWRLNNELRRNHFVIAFRLRTIAGWTTLRLHRCICSRFWDSYYGRVSGHGGCLIWVRKTYGFKFKYMKFGAWGAYPLCRATQTGDSTEYTVAEHQRRFPPVYLFALAFHIGPRQRQGSIVTI
jgi:hypothetical protein